MSWNSSKFNTLYLLFSSEVYLFRLGSTVELNIQLFFKTSRNLSDFLYLTLILHFLFNFVLNFFRFGYFLNLKLFLFRIHFHHNFRVHSFLHLFRNILSYSLNILFSISFRLKFNRRFLLCNFNNILLSSLALSHRFFVPVVFKRNCLVGFIKGIYIF